MALLHASHTHICELRVDRQVFNGLSILRDNPRSLRESRNRCIYLREQRVMSNYFQVTREFLITIFAGIKEALIYFRLYDKLSCARILFGSPI